MSVDPIARPATLDAPLATWLAEVLDGIGSSAAVHTSLGGAETAPFVLIDTSARPAGVAAMGGHDHVTLAVRWTCVADSKAAAKALADQVREALTGRSPGGAWAHDLTLDGVTTVHRDPGDDGAADLIQGVHQWTETSRLVLGRAPTEVE